MNTINIDLGEGSRSLRIEQDKSNPAISKRYRIYANNEDDTWREKENIDIEDIPVDDLLGVITIKNAKDFTFDGKGALSGEDLLFIANHITQHPSFKEEA